MATPADINECTMQGVCQNGDCLNTQGSFLCACKPGFVSDRSRCVGETPFRHSAALRLGRFTRKLVKNCALNLHPLVLWVDLLLPITFHPSGMRLVERANMTFSWIFLHKSVTDLILYDASSLMSKLKCLPLTDAQGGITFFFMWLYKSLQNQMCTQIYSV